MTYRRGGLRPACIARARLVATVGAIAMLAAGGALGRVGPSAALAATVKRPVKHRPVNALGSAIDLFAIEEQSGPFAAAGNEVLAGLQLAALYANSKRLLGSTTLTITPFDTASNAFQAAAQFNAVLAFRPPLIFGPLLSAEALAVAPLAQNASVVDLAIESQPDELLSIGRYIWQASPSPLRYINLVPEGVDAAVKTNRSVRLLYLSDIASMAASERQMEAKFRALKWTVLPAVQAPSTTTTPAEWRPYLAQLEAGKPGAIGLLVLPQHNAPLITTLRSDSYTGQLFGADTMADGALRAAGGAANGTLYAAPYGPSLRWPSAVTFTRYYERHYGGRLPSSYSASGWDAMLEVVDALQRSGASTSDGVLQGLTLLARQGIIKGAMGPERLTGIGGRDLSVPGALMRWRNGAEQVLRTGNPSWVTQP